MSEIKPSLLEVICEWRNWADNNPNVPNALIGSKRANRIDDAINRGDETARQRDALLEAAELAMGHPNPIVVEVLRAAIDDAKGEGS